MTHHPKHPAPEPVTIEVGQEMKTFEKFCQELGKDIDRDFCREIKTEIENCPQCKVYFDTIRRTVKLYQSCEENAAVDEVREDRLFKVLNLEKPKTGK